MVADKIIVIVFCGIVSISKHIIQDEIEWTLPLTILNEIYTKITYLLCLSKMSNFLSI